MQREYAGTDLAVIRESLREDGFTELLEDRGDSGFDVWKPFDDLPSHDCVHAVVWPRKSEDALPGEPAGYWLEEY